MAVFNSREPQLRKAANEPRHGAPRREGNISPEQFTDIFGFRGVQFGNYVECDRRQSDLNECHDALIDLAEALNVSPRALSLDGSLAMSFGARGGGRYVAHYEPTQAVINITKKRGPGSLAHEWFHALDNYLARFDATGRTDTRGGSYASDFNGLPRALRPEIVNAFKHLRAVLSRGTFASRSDKLDCTRSTPYYGTTIEKAARAFEIYVSDVLEPRGIVNDYLANIYKGAEAGIEWEDCAYPFPREMNGDGIRAALAAIFKTLQTVNSGKGVRFC